MAFESEALHEVTVTALQVAADIGVYTHEHGRPQPLLVDVIVRITPPEADRLEQSIDYQRIADDAYKLGTSRIALIETYALRLAQCCLSHPRALAAEVRVSKPGALRGALAGTRVLLTRTLA
ncbi:MAG: dihydroneopterin aldolase [Sphingomonas sp.]|uniref:dihydroneopterin aldolase n=1 Tax=Sphingomonas sp. TaxID=28214 RepID=UPI001AC1AC4B|nr:dihydroneopterin aldolase [Sphingomonas sp.]MBN8816825.1 dihydroneopterin aldolase [Sphingomonas sp.]